LNGIDRTRASTGILTPPKDECTDQGIDYENDYSNEFGLAEPRLFACWTNGFGSVPELGVGVLALLKLRGVKKSSRKLRAKRCNFGKHRAAQCFPSFDLMHRRAKSATIGSF
jgi:hypothetical protein